MRDYGDLLALGQTGPCPESLDPAKEKQCAGILRSVYCVRLLGAKMEVPVNSIRTPSWIEENWYTLGFWVFFVPTFLGCWIYCIASYGFLLGVGLGWLPSAITAAIVALVWPLVLTAVALVLAYLFLH